MEKKAEWFMKNDDYGFIEYKKNGKVSIYLFINGTPTKIELKQED